MFAYHRIAFPFTYFFHNLSNLPISLVTPCAVDIRQQIRCLQWHVCGCTYPSPFPATGDKNPPEMYIPTEGSKGYGSARERIGNERQRERGKSGDVRTGRKERSFLEFFSKPETLVPPLSFSARVVYFFE